jgi:membrane dipeptidase
MSSVPHDKTTGWLDAHLDLASIALAGRDMTLATEALAAPGPDAPPAQRQIWPPAVTFPALAEGPVTSLVGTIFVQARRLGSGKGDEVDGPWCFSNVAEAHAACLRQLALYQRWHAQGFLRLVTAPALGEVPTGARTHAAPFVLLMLEGAVGLRNEDDLAAFHAAGVRMLSLTWAEGSPWAGGNGVGGDLTEAGRGLIRQIDNLGMVHDVSHLSEKAFWSLLAESPGPICATHSNCRALLAGQERNERHLTDAQIQALLARKYSEAGGMIGINLYGKFLVAGGGGRGAARRATIGDVVAHVQRICQIAGRADGVGLGSDMDGGLSAQDLPEGLDHPRHLHRLAEALADAGFTDAQIQGFRAGNWRRFFGRTLGVLL